MTSSATSLSPFEPRLSVATNPWTQSQACSVLAPAPLLQSLNWTRETLLQTITRQCYYTNQWRVPALSYSPGQKVWLTAKNVHPLANSHHTTLETRRWTKSSAIKLPLHIHPTFHVPQLEPVVFSARCRSELSTACNFTGANYSQNSSRTDPNCLFFIVFHYFPVLIFNKHYYLIH